MIPLVTTWVIPSLSVDKPGRPARAVAKEGAFRSSASSPPSDLRSWWCPLITVISWLLHDMLSLFAVSIYFLSPPPPSSSPLIYVATILLDDMMIGDDHWIDPSSATSRGADSSDSSAQPPTMIPRLPASMEASGGQEPVPSSAKHYLWLFFTFFWHAKVQIGCSLWTHTLHMTHMSFYVHALKLKHHQLKWWNTMADPDPPKTWPLSKIPRPSVPYAPAKGAKQVDIRISGGCHWLISKFAPMPMINHDQGLESRESCWACVIPFLHSLRSNMLQPSISPKVPNHVMQRHSTAEPIISELTRGDMSHSNTTYSSKGPLQITILGLCVYIYPIHLSIYLPNYLSI